MMVISRLFCLLLVASSCQHGFEGVQAFQFPRGGKTEAPLKPISTSTTHPASSSTWSSYATVDPSKILSLLVKKAGFFLDAKLRSFANFLHCETAMLNIVDRELEVVNFTVSLPDQPFQQHALRIGRIYVTWDSYKRPCLELEVEDVDVMVEFANLLLTRNNWNELNDLGFPPEMVYYEEDQTTTSSSSKPKSEYLRIGSLDLQGKVVLHTRSRPLQKALTEDIVLNLRALKDLKYEVQALAEQNLRTGGRRGCTSDEVYEIVRSFFNAKLKDAVKYAIEDLAASKFDPQRDSKLASDSKQVLASAKAALRAYAEDLESVSKENIKGKLKDLRVDQGEVLLKDEDVDQIVTGGVDAVKDTLSSVGIQMLKGILQRQNTTKVEETNHNLPESDDDKNNEPFFPDW